MRDEYDVFEPYQVRVKVPKLNVRKTADKNGKIVTTISQGNYTIVEESNGFGRLKSGDGWVSLEFVTRI